jgi:hypothetical protein
MVEFAFVAPMFFLLVLGIVVVGLVAGNQNLLSNSVRDVARSAAICGGSSGPRDPLTELPAVGSLPAQSCSWAHLDTYAAARLGQIGGNSTLSAPAGGANCLALTSGAALVCLYDKGDAVKAIAGGSNPLDDCKAGYKIDISSRYLQPVYLPLLGQFIGDNGTTTRTLTADAEATCEQ